MQNYQFKAKADAIRQYKSSAIKYYHHERYVAKTLSFASVGELDESITGYQIVIGLMLVSRLWPSLIKRRCTIGCVCGNNINILVCSPTKRISRYTNK